MSQEQEKDDNTNVVAEHHHPKKIKLDNNELEDADVRDVAACIHNELYSLFKGNSGVDLPGADPKDLSLTLYGKKYHVALIEADFAIDSHVNNEKSVIFWHGPNIKK